MSVLNYGVQSFHLLQFGVQSRISSLAFRATISLQLNVQSYHIFSITMFRVVFLSLNFRYVSSQLWHSELSSSSFGVQSCIFSLAFRVTIPSQFYIQSRHIFSVWPLEPCFQFGVQSHLSLGVQSHHLFPVWRSKSMSLHGLAFRATFLAFKNIVHSLEFRAIVHTHSGIQNHHISSF